MGDEEQPELTDGLVTLRPWRDEDIERAIAGHDEEIAYWFGMNRCWGTVMGGEWRKNK